jgi:hypothetical protein
LSAVLLHLSLDTGGKALVDEWQDTTSGDSGLDECIQFFISTDGELEMTGSDTFDTKIFRGIAYPSL